MGRGFIHPIRFKTPRQPCGVERREWTPLLTLKHQVAIGFPQRMFAGMEFRGFPPNRYDPDLRGQVRVDRPSQPRRRKSCGYCHTSDLPHGVHPGVGPAGSMDRAALPGNLTAGALDALLYRQTIRLPLPTAKRPAIILNPQAKIGCLIHASEYSCRINGASRNADLTLPVVTFELAENACIISADVYHD